MNADTSEAPQGRTGAELNRATKPFAEEDRARTWRLWALTLIVWSACEAGALFVPWWPARLAFAILAGLTAVRAFIFYHDYLHRAVWVDSKLGGAFMTAVGFLVLAPPNVWRETHNFHHKNNAKLVGSSIGSFPVVTAGMYRGMNEKQRRGYRLLRHPLIILTGYLTLFAVGMCLAPFKRDPKQHWGGPVALVLHVGILVGLGLWGGLSAALFGAALPLAIACASGAYLFYAQHNFPAIELRGRRDWDYTHAALKSSSLFEMSRTMHWLTGNIGYHHVHHLNHRIPFYRLPEAMEALPELQTPGRTSWRLADIRACLALDVWDADAGRMVNFSELPEPTPNPALKAA